MAKPWSSGVLWDAEGNNVKGKQVEGIPGTIPTVTIGSVPDAVPQPSASRISTGEGTSCSLTSNASAALVDDVRPSMIVLRRGYAGAAAAFGERSHAVGVHPGVYPRP